MTSGKFDASNFDGSLNLDSCLKRVQSIKRLFHVEEYSDEKGFKAVVYKPESYALCWYESTKKQRAGDGKCKIRLSTKFKELMDKRFLVGTYNQKPHSRVSSLNQGSLRGNEYIHGFEHQVEGEIVRNQITSRKTLSKPIIWASSPKAHFVSGMAESHPTNEEAKGKCKEVLNKTQRKLDVEEEGKMEDEMIFILPDEGQLLELPEIKQELSEEDEFNHKIQPNKTTKNDVPENDVMRVLSFTEQSSLALTFVPF